MVNELRHLLRSTSTTKDNRVLWDLGVGQGVWLGWDRGWWTWEWDRG